MEDVQKNKLKGRIVSHTIRVLPKKVEQLRGGSTLTKPRKLGSFLEIQPDGEDTGRRPKTYIVPSRKEEHERSLETMDPTPDVCNPVYNALIHDHPLGEEREFTEIVTKRGGQTLRRCELECDRRKDRD